MSTKGYSITLYRNEVRTDLSELSGETLTDLAELVGKAVMLYNTRVNTTIAVVCLTDVLQAEHPTLPICFLVFLRAGRCLFTPH